MSDNTIPDNPYEKGRKDQREEVLKYLREEALHWRSMKLTKSQSDIYVAAFALEAVARDIEAWK